VWPSNFVARCGGAPPVGGKPEMRTRAASMASADVPDMRPRTSMDLEAMKRAQKIFTTEGTEATEKTGREERKE
jgi:hypothetical protein